MRKFSIIVVLLLLFLGAFISVNNLKSGKTEKVINSSLEENTIEQLQVLPGGSPTPTTGPTVTLYDGAINSLPANQGMVYFTDSLQVTQSLTTGATILDTTISSTPRAGYTANLPTIDRQLGFTLHFTVQIISEDHSTSDKNSDGIGDRAGYNVILISNDLKGIELGFWNNEIWAQDDGANLFIHGEGVASDTSTSTRVYDLTILGNRYTLSSGGVKLLSNRIRDYTASPIIFYNTPNFLFLGDDTTNANAKIKLSGVSYTTNVAASLLHVTNTGDSATPLAFPITLREALNNAAALGGGTITFDNALGVFPTITLTAPLTITGPVTITAIPDITVTSCSPALLIIASSPNLLQLGNGVTLVAVEIDTSSGPALKIMQGKNILKCSVVKKV